MLNDRPCLSRLPEAIADRVRTSGPSVVIQALTTALNTGGPAGSFGSEFSTEFGPVTDPVSRNAYQLYIRILSGLA